MLIPSILDIKEILEECQPNTNRAVVGESYQPIVVKVAADRERKLFKADLVNMLPTELLEFGIQAFLSD